MNNKWIELNSDANHGKFSKSIAALLTAFSLFCGLVGITPIDVEAGGNVSKQKAVNQIGQEIAVEELSEKILKQSPINLILEASFEGNVAKVWQLLKEGANVNAQDGELYTPLHHAASKGHIEVAKMLIEYGAEVNATSRWGETPLRLAASWNGHIEIIKVLIDNGANVNAEDQEGWTPLHWAAHMGHIDIIYPLLNAGADVNAVNGDGDTPLMISKRRGNQEVAKLLEVWIQEKACIIAMGNKWKSVYNKQNNNNNQ